MTSTTESDQPLLPEDEQPERVFTRDHVLDDMLDIEYDGRKASIALKALQEPATNFIQLCRYFAPAMAEIHRNQIIDAVGDGGSSWSSSNYLARSKFVQALALANRYKAEALQHLGAEAYEQLNVPATLERATFIRDYLEWRVQSKRIEYAMGNVQVVTAFSEDYRLPEEIASQDVGQ